MQPSEEKIPKKSSISGIVVAVIVVAAVFGLIALIGSNSSNNTETSTTVPESPAAQPIPKTSTPSVPAENPILSQTQTQSTPTQPAPPTPPPASKSWHTVTTFSGSGKQNTLPFTIQDTEWKIDWTATVPEDCGGDGCDMYIGIHKTAGGIGDYVMTPNLTANGSGSSYEYNGSGTFYFTVDPGAISAWRVSVEDYYY